MSFYSTMTGEIQYADLDSFHKMIKELQDHKWMDNDHYFLDECGGRLYDDEYPDANVNTRTICIPLYHFRNLARVNFFMPGAKGRIVGASTDGCFEGWVIDDGIEVRYDLTKWAAKIGNIPPNPDTDFVGYCEWQYEVERDFFDMEV